MKVASFHNANDEDSFRERRAKYDPILGAMVYQEKDSPQTSPLKHALADDENTTASPIAKRRKLGGRG